MNMMEQRERGEEETGEHDGTKRERGGGDW